MLTCSDWLTKMKRGHVMHSLIRRRYIIESVVLPDQLVGAAVLVSDGDGTPGDGGYVPVVVVGVGISHSLLF